MNIYIYACIDAVNYGVMCTVTHPVLSVTRLVQLSLFYLFKIRVTFNKYANKTMYAGMGCLWKLEKYEKNGTWV